MSVNFRQSLALNANQVYGKPINHQQITMKDLLLQNEQVEHINKWDFKSQKKIQQGLEDQYVSKISRDNKETEYLDQYKTLRKNQNITYLDDLNYETINKLQQTRNISNENKKQPVFIKDEPLQHQLYKQQIPSDTTVYDKDYSQVQIKNKQQLRRSLLENRDEIRQKKQLFAHKQQCGYDLYKEFLKGSQQQEGVQNQNQNQINCQQQENEIQEINENKNGNQNQIEEIQAQNSQQQEQQRQKEAIKNENNNSKTQNLINTMQRQEKKAAENLKQKNQPKNKFQETLSRYSQIKTTLEQDRRLLNERKKVREQEAQQRFSQFDELKKYDPNFAHRYLTPNELNPQNYPNPQNIWIQQLPPAGKRVQRNYYVNSVLQPDFEVQN